MKNMRRNDVAIFIAIFLVVAYVFYECYSVTHIELVTETALPTTVYEQVDAQALVVRQEHIIDNADDGVTVASNENGAKIKVGGNVGMVFDSQKSASNYSKYVEARDRLEYYEDLRARSVGQAANVESINDDIHRQVNDYIRSLNTNKDIDDAADALNGSLVKRQLIIGEKIDFSAIISDLQQKTDKYSSYRPTGYISTSESGVFSTYADGYESILDYDNIEDVTAKQVNSAIKKIDKKSAKSTKHLGKLVTAYNWYMVTVVDSECVKSLADGDKIEIALKDSDTTIKMTIVKGAEPDMGVEKTVLVLKSNDMNAQYAMLRKVDVSIRYRSYTGIKVPVEALHVKDNKKGVYALVSSQVRFREADVLYSDKDYVLLSFDPDNSDGIRLYDKIIVQGKELEDGKVYT